MFELLVAQLRYPQSSSEVAHASNPQVTVLLLLGVVGVAAVAVVVTAWAVSSALVAADPAGASTRFRQTADPWRLLAQSDPDAPGRARPRAPTSAVAAA